MGGYDLGVAYEHGYGGAHYDVDLAWAYYLRAAQPGSSEAQMALAQAYSAAGRRGDAVIMLQCAYQQGHGPAAYKLAIKAGVNNQYQEAIYDALEINPDLKLSRLDQVLPLPPAPLPKWSGVDGAVEPESNGRPTY